MFSCKLCEICKNTFLIEHLQVTTFWSFGNIILLWQFLDLAYLSMSTLGSSYVSVA